MLLSTHEVVSADAAKYGKANTWWPEIQLLYDHLFFSNFPKTCRPWREWRAVLICVSPFLDHSHHTGCHCSMTPSQFMASIFQGVVAGCFRIRWERAGAVTQWWRACLASMCKALGLVPSTTHTQELDRSIYDRLWLMTALGLNFVAAIYNFVNLYNLFNLADVSLYFVCWQNTLYVLVKIRGHSAGPAPKR